MKIETGAQLITKERKEQIEKHGRTIEKDCIENSQFELTKAASSLTLNPMTSLIFIYGKPDDWNQEVWLKMCSKPYKERLIIAGALIAAEIDRIISIE